MQCPFCKHRETKVVDKRDIGSITRRRRECLKCSKRFSSQESLEAPSLRVIKKDGSRQEFDREKVKRGIIRACEKRPITEEQIENMVINVEQKLMRKGREASSGQVGEAVSIELKRADKVAYIRFASVYREFADLSDFKREIRGLVSQ